MDKRGICSSFGMDGDGVPRSELERRCLRSFGAEEIGRGFKRYLLRRYGPRWERFRELQPDIFEIDYQWFYRHGLRPRAVY